jgi:serine/threonine-protein kinase
MASLNDTAPEAHSVAPGTLIADRYRVEDVLGEGGMGIVYRAEHVHIRKRVAIKVLLPRWTRTAEVVARFEREAVAAGAIADPHVAAATDFGRLADGSFFLVLEYLEGRTLRSELKVAPFEPVRALAIARGIALGIAAAHAKGVVHRDLKPENVMLVERDGDPDFVKVLDFGIARIEGPPAASGPALTSAGAILGTPDYMAPEQALGTPVDARADLYALGVMLFEMLTGGCPFRGGAVTVLRQHMLTPPPPLPPEMAARLPTAVQVLVARLLQKEPDARYANATELDYALQECIAALAPPKPGPVVVAARPADRLVHAAQRLHANATRALVGALGAARRRPTTVIIAGLAMAIATLLVVASIGLSVSASSAPGARKSAAP